MQPRAPHLYRPLHCFCLSAFAALAGELEAGAELPFEFEEHASRGRPALYEYRPLVRAFVETRTEGIAALEDAQIALDEIRREPAAAIFARAHAGAEPGERQALFRTVLLPLLMDTAEACGGFDWDDRAFERAYLELERSLLGSSRAYAAVVPLVGVSLGSQVELGNGVRVRAAAPGELSTHWPEAARLLPPSWGREPDRLCILELERALPAQAEDPPDAPGELADAVTALRLATAGAIAAGPVLFERLDWRPYGIRPMLPISATVPGGEPTRLDRYRGELGRDLLERLVLADDDPELGEAVDRWELSLFQAEPFRSEQLREALAALLGGSDGLWAGALRAAILIGETGRERGDLLERLRTLVRGESAGAEAADGLRRALVEVLVHGERERLVESLDESLLGLRPRPAGYFAARAAAS